MAGLGISWANAGADYTTGFTWLGWWAKGAFAGSSLGLLVAFVVAGLVYAVWAVPVARRGQPYRPAVQAPTS
jgi:hypothetical protein